MGRHSRPEDLGEPDDVPATEVAEGPAGRHSARPAARRGTAGDVKLVREHPDVRNRCVAAVLVPFIVYTVVLVALGRTDAYLFWLFAPTIGAGLLVGGILDHAHKRYPDG